MTKRTTFTAVDPSGRTHTRTSDVRWYSHTVVVQHSKAKALASATAPSHAVFDGKAYDYEVACASGTHEHVTRITDASVFHASYSAEYVANAQARQRAEHARRIASAAAEIAGLTREDYIAKRLAERLARVEATDFTIWHNCGWCSRRDLAVRLASKSGGTILEAVAH